MLTVFSESGGDSLRIDSVDSMNGHPADADSRNALSPGDSPELSPEQSNRPHLAAGTRPQH